MIISESAIRRIAREEILKILSEADYSNHKINLFDPDTINPDWLEHTLIDYHGFVEAETVLIDALQASGFTYRQIADNTADFEVLLEKFWATVDDLLEFRKVQVDGEKIAASKVRGLRNKQRIEELKKEVRELLQIRPALVKLSEMLPIVNNVVFYWVYGERSHPSLDAALEAMDQSDYYDDNFMRPVLSLNVGDASDHDYNADLLTVWSEGENHYRVNIDDREFGRDWLLKQSNASSPEELDRVILNMIEHFLSSGYEIKQNTDMTIDLD